jgi:hypothetical protein
MSPEPRRYRSTPEGDRLEEALRAEGEGAKNKADREFVETAVRLQRAGEESRSAGMRPAGIDTTLATAAAEEALESGRLRPLLALLIGEVGHGVVEQHQRALAKQAPRMEPGVKAEVPGQPQGRDTASSGARLGGDGDDEVV